MRGKNKGKLIYSNQLSFCLKNPLPDLEMNPPGFYAPAGMHRRMFEFLLNKLCIPDDSYDFQDEHDSSDIDGKSTQKLHNLGLVLIDEILFRNNLGVVLELHKIPSSGPSINTYISISFVNKYKNQMQRKKPIRYIRGMDIRFRYVKSFEDLIDDISSPYVYSFEKKKSIYDNLKQLILALFDENENLTTDVKTKDRRYDIFLGEFFIDEKYESQITSHMEIAKILRDEVTRLGYAVTSSPHGYFSYINMEVLGRGVASDITPENFESRALSSFNDYSEMLRGICDPSNNRQVIPKRIDSRQRGIYVRKEGFSKHKIMEAIKKLGYSIHYDDQREDSQRPRTDDPERMQRKILTYAHICSRLPTPSGNLTTRIRGFGGTYIWQKIVNLDGSVTYTRSGHVGSPKIPYYYRTEFYENIYRALALTSQHLPWGIYLYNLKNKQEIPLTSEALKFIAVYDYNVSPLHVEGSTDLQLCQMIRSRIDIIQQHFFKETQEIQTNQPAFILRPGGLLTPSGFSLGGFAPTATSAAWASMESEVFQEINQLCERIRRNPEAVRWEDIRQVIREMDLESLFKNNLMSYQKEDICKILRKHLETQRTSRAYLAAVETKYL